MPEFAPITTLQDLGLVDEAEALAGYHAGMHGLPEPVASCFSRSFLHGWRNGACDAGLLEPTPAQRLLAHAIRMGESAAARAEPGDPEGYAFPCH